MANWTINDLIALRKRQTAKARGRDEDAVAEHAAGDVSIREDEIPPWCRGAYSVGISVIRKRLADNDDLTPKYLIDAIARASFEEKGEFAFIPGDAPSQLQPPLIRQRKCRKGEPEHVIIDLWITEDGPPQEWREHITSLLAQPTNHNHQTT